MAKAKKKTAKVKKLAKTVPKRTAAKAKGR